MGVWIEIMIYVARCSNPAVAPLVGVWIEIQKKADRVIDEWVAPLVGVWIEIIQNPVRFMICLCRSPRGSVD